jgi:hypothetical protein
VVERDYDVGHGSGGGEYPPEEEELLELDEDEELLSLGLLELDSFELPELLMTLGRC